MNQVQYHSPICHYGLGLPSHPTAILIDEPTVTGDLLRTPHIFGGLTPLLEIASRIAAGIDPRSFLDQRYGDPEHFDEDKRAEVLHEAIEKAAGFSAAYARRLIAACDAVQQIEQRQAQEQAAAQAAQTATHKSSHQQASQNGRGRIIEP